MSRRTERSRTCLTVERGSRSAEERAGGESGRREQEEFVLAVLVQYHSRAFEFTFHASSSYLEFSLPYRLCRPIPTLQRATMVFVEASVTTHCG
jgi:hypothetical protein